MEAPQRGNSADNHGPLAEPDTRTNAEILAEFRVRDEQELREKRREARRHLLYATLCAAGVMPTFAYLYNYLDPTGAMEQEAKDLRKALEAGKRDFEETVDGKRITFTINPTVVDDTARAELKVGDKTEKYSIRVIAPNVLEVTRDGDKAKYIVPLNPQENLQ